MYPKTDAARIRAFFVCPSWTRKGLARRLLHKCEREAMLAGFARAELMATLPGVPFYSAHGYRELGRTAVPLREQLSIEFVSMSKALRA